MAKKSTIRIIISAGLMLIFAMAITPRILLHNLVAHHKDSLITVNDHHKTQINKPGFQCNCDHLVAESLFVYEYHHITFSAPAQFPELEHSILQSYRYAPYFRFGLRGPPAVV